MGKLAITGGKPLRKKRFDPWPIFTDKEKKALKDVLENHDWGGQPFPGKHSDAFAKKFADKVSAMKVGNGLEDGVAQGPLIDMKAVEKVEEHISDALSKGAHVLTGGKRHEKGGQYFQPTVLVDVNTDMKVTHEETFGPVAPLYRFKTEDELLKLANDTEYGLAAYFYSRDIGRVWRVAEGLESGIVGINVGIISTEVAPFGGVKQSGIGREGSKYGIEEFLEVKYLCLGDINK